MESCGRWSGTMTCSGPNGALYDANSTLAFPSGCKTVLAAISNSELTGGYFGYVSMGFGSTSSSFALHFISSTNASRTWYVSYYVVGKWK